MNPSHKTLLIVDDIDASRNDLNQQLSEAGFNTIMASSGPEALEIVKKRPVDLVLLDLVLKGLDGIEVLETLRKSFTLISLPIIIVTAKSDTQDVVLALEQQANDYLVKPVDIPVALARIRTHLLLKELEEKLENQRSRALGAARMASLGEMAGGVAHEINNPLAIICATANILEITLQQNSPDKQAQAIVLAQRIEKTGYRIAKIVQGLRQFARNASGDEWVKCSLLGCIQEAIALCDPSLKNGEIAFNLDEANIPSDLTVHSKPTELSQAFYYVLSNACDAVENHPNRWITITGEKVDQTIEVRITDSGSGIPEEHREKIFQPFYSTKTAGNGMGLSLSLTRRMIESHGGKIFVDPLRRNTCFVISLPISDPV